MDPHVWKSLLELIQNTLGWLMFSTPERWCGSSLVFLTPRMIDRDIYYKSLVKLEFSVHQTELSELFWAPSWIWDYGSVCLKIRGPVPHFMLENVVLIPRCFPSCNRNHRNRFGLVGGFKHVDYFPFHTWVDNPSHWLSLHHFSRW